MAHRWTRSRRPAQVAGAVLLVWAAALAVLSGCAWRAYRWVADLLFILASPDNPLTFAPETFSAMHLSGFLSSGAASAALAGLVMLAYGGSRRAVPAVCLIILVLHPLDVFGWKFRQLFIRTAPIPEAFKKEQKLSPLPYRARRSLDYTRSARYGSMPEATLNRNTYLAWFADSYFGVDLPGSGFRTDYWMRPVNDFMCAMTKGKLVAGNAPADGRGLRPKEHGAGDKLVGVSEDKIQFFADAFRVRTPGEVAPLLHHPRFGGDVLFVNAALGSDAPAREWKYQIAPQANERLAAKYEVLRFDANSLRLAVDVPGSASRPWLLYCDAFDKGWTARVNDRPVPVHRANLAYKAVRLDPGKSTVEFRYSSPWRSFCIAIWYLVSSFWFGAVIWQLVAWLLGWLREPLVRGATRFLSLQDEDR
ncbi:MAG: hypothetical protein HY815_03670 [Candidatus Riflebacteria bacterium]|nr:hypothetical protein [Candidatus Riflebacteria bacterium]